MVEQRAIVTIQDVAARAGVSAMTVSRVINKRGRVAARTRERVEQAIAELHYVPNALARGLLHGRTRTIALVVSDINNPFFTVIARGVEDVARRNGYTVFFGNSDESAEKEQQYVNALLSNRIEGLLITPASVESRPTLDLLERRGIPFVLIDRYIEGVPADVVVGDSIGGARMLTEHLLQLGHRQIALVNGPGVVSTARDRRRGYEEALRIHGLEPQPDLIIGSNYRRSGGVIAARQLMALPADRQPSAIVSSNNFLSVGIIEALREARVRVPEDIALVSFDDMELASALYPFLTVAAQPARTFGTIAAQFLFERLDSVEPWTPRRVVLQPELIIRVSCGAHLKPLARAGEVTPGAHVPPAAQLPREA